MGCLDFILQFSLTFDALLLPCLLVLPELCSPAREQKMLRHCGVLPARRLVLVWSKHQV